jgi:hypothetical protein
VTSACRLRTDFKGAILTVDLIYPANIQGLSLSRLSSAFAVCAQLAPMCQSSTLSLPMRVTHWIAISNQVPFHKLPSRLALHYSVEKTIFMDTASDPYEDVAFVYIRLVILESREAAGVIMRIYTAFGSRAALRAALIITLMKIEIHQNHWVPYIGLYLHLLDDYPDALPLAKYAMTLCLESWAVPVIATSEWAELPIPQV